MRLVVIDNYDSFTYNLVQLFYEFDLEVLIYRHDQVSLSDIEQLKPDWICISPGPKDPAHAGISKAVIACFGHHVPILGVCLGMQAINEVFGGSTCKAPVPVHGKRCRIRHSGRGIFADIPSPLWVARYHSLAIALRTSFLVPVAYADDGVIMAIQHRSWPLWGVQFHPESFLTDFGYELVRNFLATHPEWRTKTTSSADPADRFPRLGRLLPWASPN